MLATLMTPYAVLLLVPLVALSAFVVIGLDPFQLSRKQVHRLALAGGILPLVLMTPMALLCMSGTCNGLAPIFTLTVGTSVVALALLLDPLSMLFGMTVATIGACVITYSVSYMEGTPLADLRRYFALMNLFLAAMLTMVLAGDSIVFFLGWEMMGLCSFFLIAYNTESVTAITAGRKAFIMTRIADAFLLAALLLLFLEAGSVRLEVLIPAGVAMDENRRMIIAWLLLGGALGKSAQVPFHTWLPSAMAGPTPVSALLHSATMVAAGAFLLIRFAPLMQQVPPVQMVAAILGVVTAAYGALSALFQQDVKRLLAYSSISQIGFMMLSIGVGAPEAAAAHFVVHAIFKSLLFLSAGDLVHGSSRGTDLAALRGAAKRRPLAYAAFAAGAASLAGLPVVTAGWWSKEAVLTAVLGSAPLGGVLWAVALFSAVLTGAYALRPVMIGLAAEPTGLDAHEHSHGHGHHPSKTGNAYTWAPLLALGFGALTAGVLVGPIIRLLGAEPPHAEGTSVRLAAAAPFAGALLAAALAFVPALSDGLVRVRRIGRNVHRDLSDGRPMSRFVRIALWFSRGARVDDLYQAVFVLPFARLVRWLNGHGTTVEDPFGNLPVIAATRMAEPKSVADPVGTLFVMGISRATDAITQPMRHDIFDQIWTRIRDSFVGLWQVVRRLQTGQTRDYALAMAAGTAALLLLAWGSS